MKHIKPLPQFSEKDIFNFWQKVDKTSSDKNCWLWTGAKSTKGYGILNCDLKKQVKAHRIAFYLAGGITTAEKPLICHGPCHNPACVNPDHLEAGSSKKNITDQVRDGSKLWGTKTNSAKLDPDKVREIRNLFSLGNVTAITLGEKYQVDPTVIMDVVYRYTWDHVDVGEPPKIPETTYREPARGTKNAAAKIDESIVREIRALRNQRWIMREIAEKFGLSITNVSDILKRKIWAHVDPDEPLPAPGQYR